MSNVDDEELSRERGREAAVQRKVVRRRYTRYLKASAAIALSLVAGTFLACQREKPAGRPTPAPNPTTPEVSNLPAPPNADASGGNATEATASGGTQTGATGAGGSQTGATGSGSTSTGDKHNQVDKHEHRKGMPVRDNLVE